MIDVIVSGGINLTVEDTGDIINVVVEVAAPISVDVVVGIPTKENIVGLSKVDSPEFADVVIPDIAEESSYPASALAWLTGIFGVVTGSVKAMLVALVERVTSLDERVDKTLYDITISEPVNLVVFDSLNISEKEVVNINIYSKSWANSSLGSGYMYFSINDITRNSYTTATNNITGYGSLLASFRINPRNKLIADFSLKLINGNPVFNALGYTSASDFSVISAFTASGELVENVTSINKISISSSSLASFKPSDRIVVTKKRYK